MSATLQHKHFQLHFFITANTCSKVVPVYKVDNAESRCRRCALREGETCSAFVCLQLSCYMLYIACLSSVNNFLFSYVSDTLGCPLQAKFGR